LVGIGVAPGTGGALRKISNFRNSKSSLIAKGKGLALSIGSGISALTMMLPISTAKNAPASRHLIEERSNSEAEEVSIKDFRQKNAVNRTYQRLGRIGESENRRIGVLEYRSIGVSEPEDAFFIL
jgi:hypothetical protein